MEPQQTLNSQSSVEKENQSWRHHNPGLEPVLQSCNHQDSIVLAQEQTNDQQNRIENPEMDPQIYGQLIFNKAAKSIQWNKDISSANGIGKTGEQHAKE